MSKDHVPDIVCSNRQMENLKKICEIRPKDTDAKKKLACAERVLKQENVTSRKRKAPKDRPQVLLNKGKRRKSRCELERANAKLNRA